MRDLGRHRGKHHFFWMSLTPITFDANTFSCCGGSYFATIVVFIINCRRPLNLVGPPLPTSLSLFTTATITTSSEYVPLQNCLLPLSFRPRGCCSCLHQQFRHFLLRVTSHEHGACPPRLYTFVYCFHTLRKVRSTGSFLLQRIYLYGLTLALHYNTILRKGNIDEFRLYVWLLTSSIRGHLLSLKFRPHRATRTPHRQHRKTVIHGTRINYTAQQNGSKLYKMAKKLQSAMHPLGVRTRARNILVHGAHMHGCGVQNPCACQTTHLWNWSASQPLMDRLPSRFDTKSELNPRGGAGQRPNGALKSPSSHSKEVA
jgi:hypothetical protein